MEKDYSVHCVSPTPNTLKDNKMKTWSRDLPQSLFFSLNTFSAILSPKVILLHAYWRYLKLHRLQHPLEFEWVFLLLCFFFFKPCEAFCILMPGVPSVGRSLERALCTRVLLVVKEPSSHPALQLSSVSFEAIFRRLVVPCCCVGESGNRSLLTQITCMVKGYLNECKNNSEMFWKHLFFTKCWLFLA